MNSGFISYYEHIAKLATVTNKTTLFLAHMLCEMEFNEPIKQNIVTLTSFDKRRILKSIGCKSKDPVRLASQYLIKLQKSGMIKSIGDGAYLIDPESFGYAKYVPKELRFKSKAIYETRVFKDKSAGVKQAWIITEDGERVDLE
jgi:hypothetical protein